MADKKRNRRPPSDKIKPGTPHPTKAYTVRGYDGRWISRKAFNAAKRARKVAEKGGALVKRSSSALNKITNRSNKLLKINKGDRGLVRGIKDTYKFGKDTRRTADALYKAGKITREIHDKLVTGGRSFIQGIKELPKDARRLFERTKPGGKIVRVSKDSPRFKYEGLPKQRGGALVKTPKTSSALTIRKKKPTTTKTTKTRKLNPRQERKLALQKQTQKTDTSFNRRWKVKGSKTNPFIGKGTNEQKLLKAGQQKVLKSSKEKLPPAQSRKASKTKSTSKFGKNILNTKGGISNPKAKQVGRIAIRGLGNIPGPKKKGQIGPLWRGLNKGIRKIKGIKTNSKVLKAVTPFAKKHVKWLSLLDTPSAVKGTIGLGKDLENARRLLLKGRRAKLIGPINSKKYGRLDTHDITSEDTLRSDESYKRHKSRREKLEAKEDATKRSNKNKPSNNNKTKVNNNNNLSSKDRDDIKNEKELSKVLANKNKSGGSPTKVSEKKTVVKSDGKSGNNQKPKDTRGKEAGAYAAGYTDGQKSKKKKTKKLTMRDRMRAKNEAIHGKEAIKKVSEYNKKWQKAKREGKLKEFKKKNPAIRHWSIGRRS